MYCIKFILYYVLSYHIISYIISYRIISYHISYRIISYHISYHIISYHITSYIISYHIICYVKLCYVTLRYLILYYIILYYILYCIMFYISCHIIYFISCHIVSCYYINKRLLCLIITALAFCPWSPKYQKLKISDQNFGVKWNCTRIRVSHYLNTTICCRWFESTKGRTTLRNDHLSNRCQRL